MSRNADTAAPAASPSVPQANAWPDDTPTRRKHRIDFYGKYGIRLDPSSSLTYEQQVTERGVESCIAGGNRKVLTLYYYKLCLSQLKKGNTSNREGFSLLKTNVRRPDGTMTTTVRMLKESKSGGGTCRVVNSCSLFDHMARIHYKNHGTTSGPKSDYMCALELVKELNISDDNARKFLMVCPVCHPENVNGDSNTTVVTPAVSTSTFPPVLSVPAQLAGATAANQPTAPLRQVNPNDAIQSRVAGPTKRGAADVIDIPDFSGPARHFVQQVQVMIDWMNPMKGANNSFRVLPADGLHYSVERMLMAQHEFRHAGKPATVDIGYHYTRSEHLKGIEKVGLLTKSERTAYNIAESRVTSNVDGIYTCSNPFGYHGQYGDVGLVVARLLGSNADDMSNRGTQPLSDSSTASRHRYNEMVAISTSKQCIPILQFDPTLLAPSLVIHPGNAAILKVHAELQTILDRVFNSPPKEQSTGRNVKAKLSGAKSDTVDAAPFKQPIASNVSTNQIIDLTSGMPQRTTTPGTTNKQTVDLTMVAASTSPAISMINHGTQPQATALATPASFWSPGSVEYVAPEWFLRNAMDFVSVLPVNPKLHQACQCPHCELPNNQTAPLYRIKTCQHVVHQFCFHMALDENPGCPKCGKAIGSPQGKMPSGTMDTSCLPNKQCAGYGPAGSICIDYDIPQGVQKSYHPKPGRQFSGAEYRAYLPETVDGCNLLKRLKYAFLHGLTFTVERNSVTWSTIPHKTVVNGGTRAGYPDPNYIAACNAELDRLEVPKAVDL